MPTINQLTGGTDMSQEVYEANRSYYSSAYSALDRAKQISANQVRQTYGQAIGETYLQGQQAQANIGASAYGKNYKTYLQNQLNRSLENAYNTYLSKQESVISEATSAYDKAMSNITSNIQQTGAEIGEYRDKYATGLIQYGANLVKSGAFKLKDYTDYAAYKADNPDNPMSEEDFLKAKQLANINWARLNGLYDTEGNINWDATKTALYAKRGERGEILTDEYGNVVDYLNEMSAEGKDILNYLMTYNNTGFGTYQDWLSENDKDLYEWSIKRSVLGDPTNAYTAMKTLGLDKTKNYNDLDALMKDLTPTQTVNLLSSYTKNISTSLPDPDNWKYKNAIKEYRGNQQQEELKKATKKTDEAYNKAVENLKDVYKNLGLEEEMKEFFSENNLKKLFNTNSTKARRGSTDTPEKYKAKLESRLKLLIEESVKYAEKHK